MKPFIFVFALMGFGLFYFSTPAEAQVASCERNADGHFVVPDQQGFANCYTAAETIGVTFKALYLCQGFPDILGGYKNCQDLKLTPFTKEVTQGFEYDSSFTMPLAGTYDHAVVVNGNEYTISGFATFDRPIQGGNQARPNGISSGRYCQPPSVDFSMYEALNQNAYALLSECSNTLPETPHKISFERDTMRATADFSNAYPNHNQITPGIGGAYLMNSAGDLAANNSEVEDIVYAVPLGAPTVITEEMTGAKMDIAMGYTLGVTFGCSVPVCVATILPGLVTPTISFE